jgi:tRNA A37 threonylcarbamoyladenosine dehydratase
VHAQPDAASEASDSRRLGGVARLYGNAGLARLRESHVAVVGIGGVGSWAVEALARSGVGRLTLIDLDVVAESNLNRQAHATLANLGRNKVDAMRERVLSFAPHCVVNVIDDFVTPENVSTLIPGDCDFVIDAIDQVRAKAALVAACVQARRPVVVCGGAGGKSDAARLTHADLAFTRQDALLSKLRALLRKQYGFPRGERKFGVAAVFSDEQQAGQAEDGAAGLACAGYGSVMHMTASMGLIAVSIVLKQLAAAPAMADAATPAA